MKNGKYSLSDSAPLQLVETRVENKNGTVIIAEERVPGVCPFGPQTGVITEEKLTDALGDFLMTKPEMAKYIVANNKSKKGE